MKGVEALGYMAAEDKIVRIRNTGLKIEIEKFPLLTGKVDLFIPAAALVSDSWELGWECAKCWGVGTISEPCGCHRRGMDNDCGNCGNTGFLEDECPECERGIRWETTY